MIERRIQTSHAPICLTDSAADGYPVLFIHGSGASRAAFRNQLQSPLAKRYRMIAVDLPGHGDSGDAHDPARTYTVGGLADCVRQVLEGLGIRRGAVFGWSLGGHIAIDLMATTDMVSGLMISGTPPISAGPIGLLRGFQLSTSMLLVSKALLTRSDAERLTRLSFGDEFPPEFIEAAMRSDGRLRAMVARSLTYGGHADQKLVVQDSSVPVAIIDGALDPFIRVSYSNSLPIRNLWGRTVIPETGHAPFWQRPETFNLMLKRFLFDVQSADEKGQPQIKQFPIRAKQASA